MDMVVLEGGNISVSDTDAGKPSPDLILSDKHELSNIYGRNILKRKIIHRNCDMGSCFLSRFDVIPQGEPRQNTLIMKACQDPDDDTGAEECTQTAMTQHIFGIILQSDYIIRLELHDSYKCIGLYMTPHGGITPSPRPHHIDPPRENCCER